MVPVHERTDILTLPDMVSRGDHLHSKREEFQRYLFCDAKSIGRVLTVHHYNIRSGPFDEFWES